jgi:hypothetical protein
MKNLGIFITSVVAAAIVALGAVSFTAPSQPTDNRAGATSPELSSPYFCFGNICQYRYRQTMAAATTTLCAVLSPAATSSVSFVIPQITVGTSAAATITIATSTSQYATTTTGTLLADHVVGSDAQDTWKASPGANSITGPNTWVLVKAASPGLGGYTFGGTCEVEFTRA